MRASLLFGALAIALPLVGAAQSVAPASLSPQFFVGLGGAVNTYQRLDGFDKNSLAPVLTAGVQLRSRLALQIGVGYRQRTDQSSFSGGGYLDDSGQSQPSSSTSSYYQRRLRVPVLVRYGVTRGGQGRFQVDMLGGLTLERYWNGYDYVVTNENTKAVVQNDFYHGAANGLYFTLGPSVRYRVGPHLDLTGDAVINCLLQRNTAPYYTFSDRLSGNLALGIRYRFARL
ncbi:outer membrane beta-barrel protein [Hymenobacter caeli]|uniref:Outer membrane protein beta-barrel domain-containing protein n=1 Tax=Hymenobacter caeli TaxID=2735894 RepID=A0ABX2FUI4_9BACT|nr:outer membrane beta-barrel protein [Hymenobacter caeli]NRT19999.1 hypothetical protein [Hymenobacter caeli]